MKLVADVDSINSNLNDLSQTIDTFSSAVSSFNSASINCSLDEVRGILDSYKSSIDTDLGKLNNSSNEFKSLVDTCCNKYKSNEENNKNISIDKINDIIQNNMSVTLDYEGNAKDKLTGLPSVEITGAGTGKIILDGTVINTSRFVENGKKYGLTNAQLAELAYVALREQGSIGGAKMELSLMANLYEKHKDKYKNVYDYVKRSGWFAKRSFQGYRYPGDKFFNAAKEVLNDGHLYLPSNVIEHDCLSDISHISTGSSRNRSNYIPGKTIIYNRMGARYVFVGFAPNGGDPFGYKV